MKSDMQETFRASEVAKWLDMPLKTLRGWETKGHWFPSCQRGNQCKRFTIDDVARSAAIVSLTSSMRLSEASSVMCKVATECKWHETVEKALISDAPIWIFVTHYEDGQPFSVFLYCGSLPTALDVRRLLSEDISGGWIGELAPSDTSRIVARTMLYNVGPDVRAALRKALMNDSQRDGPNGPISKSPI